MKLNLPSRRKNQRPKSFDLQLVGKDGTIITHKIPAAEHPTAIPLLGFGTPGILMGQLAPDAEAEMLVNVVIIGLGEDHLTNVQKIIPRGGTIYERIRPVDFGRMLAKIAHSYAIAELGLKSFNHLLLEFILERTPFDGNYLVGGDLSNLPPSDPHNLHELKWRWEDTILGRFLIVGIRLFACFGGPQYYVVTGLPISASNLSTQSS